MMTNALAIGTRHGFPGAAFLLASTLAGAALIIVVARVLGQVARHGVRARLSGPLCPGRISCDRAAGAPAQLPG
jgi:hypothetical protein